MAPPVLVLAGGAVIAVGGIVAFHQFIYEPHIAPKLEIFIENWLEQRRIKRRQRTRPVSFGDEGDVPAASSSRSRATSQVEMDTISAPLRVTSIDTGLSEANLRRRNNATSGHASLVLESPNVFIPFGTLTPLSNNDPLPGGPALSSPRLSTPSTVPSSLMELRSPSLRSVSPLAARTPSDHSRRSSTDSPVAARTPLDLSPRSSTDSILADTNHLSFATISPSHSVTHISPRALLVTIASPTGLDEDSRPLSDFTPVRRQQDAAGQNPWRNTITRTDSAHSSIRSPMGSTIYESFAPSNRSTSPVDHTIHEEATARNLRFPSPDRLQPPTRRAPRSTTSWSDVASDSGDEPEFLVGSDVESWASVSDRPT